MIIAAGLDRLRQGYRISATSVVDAVDGSSTGT
jgi:hypothetical protein